MTQPLTLTPTPSESGTSNIIRPERQNERHPILAEEVRRHQILTEALAARHRQAEQALIVWQSALARRWSCEVAAQRVYRAAQRQLAILEGADPAAGQPLGLPAPGADSTPRGLLQEVRRVAATLDQGEPLPPSAVETLVRLRIAGDDLEAAIAQTDTCEFERRRLMSEERVVARLVEQAERRAQQLLERRGG